MSDDLQIVGPATAPPAPAPPAETDPEPEGVQEIQGKRLIDVSILAAERKRVREATEQKVRAELEPLQQEVQTLRQAVQAAQPYMELVRQHPELLKPAPPTSAEQQITDDEAAQEARELQLYDTQGQLDFATARKVIVRRRAEARHVAEQVARETISPIAAQTAVDRSRANFVSAVHRAQVDPHHNLLGDPKGFAEYWAEFAPELTQHPEVAQVVIDAYLGRQLRTGNRIAPPERAPIFSEAAGATKPAVFQMTPMDQRFAHAAGLTSKDFETAAKRFKPDSINTLEDAI